MKKIFEEIIILLVQLLTFYIFPRFAVPTDSMGIIILIIIATFMLSLVIGGISANKTKYYYPMLIAILFIPAVYIFHNEFELLHTLWILVSSGMGVIIGDVIMNR